jgi:uncharacterized protein YjdB
MKRNTRNILIALLVFLLLITQWPMIYASNYNYTVTFITNGGTAVSSLIVPDGGSISPRGIKTAKEGYVFGGWYIDNTTFNEPWCFGGWQGDVKHETWSTPVSTVISDIVLYAKWLVVNESNPIETFNFISDPYLSVYYGFDNNIKSITDIAGANNNAMLVDNSLNNLSTSVAGFVDHQNYGKAVYFDQTYGLGLGKNVVVGNEFTIAFWFKPDAVVANRSVFSAYGNDNFTYNSVNYDSRMNFCPNSSSTPFVGSNFEWRVEGNVSDNSWYFKYIAPTPEILVNQWSHVAIVGNVDSYSVYIDGTVVFEKSDEDPSNNIGANGTRFTEIWANNAIDFYLGVGTLGAEAPFYGAVDEFYAFNRVLTGSEISLLKSYYPKDLSFEPQMDASLSTYFGFEDNLHAIAQGDSNGNTITVLDNNRDTNTTSTVQYVNHQNYGRALYFDQTYGLGLGKNIVQGKKFTISFWFKPDVLVQNRSVFSTYGTLNYLYNTTYYDTRMNFFPGSNGDSCSRDFWWKIQGGPSLYFDYSAPTPEQISTDVWSHVAIVSSFNSYAIYIDGYKVFSKDDEEGSIGANGSSFSNSWAKDTVDFFLGISTFGADAPFKGAVDEFYSFNRALSREEILLLKDYDSSLMPARVTGVSLDKVTMSVQKTLTSPLAAAISPSNAGNQNVIWTSSDTDHATVSSNGTVTGVDIGTATITATTVDSGFSDTCEVTVIPVS